MPTDPNPTWSVEASTTGGGDRVEVVVGEPVAVWTTGAELADVPEAWGTAFALAAARAGARLRLPGPVDPTWWRGVQANAADTASWWGGSPTLDLEIVPPPGGRSGPGPFHDASAADRAPLAPGRALCFTGGVDSFFSLLRGDHRPTHLLFVLGYDVDLDDADRTAQVLSSLDAIADATGTAPLVVRTTLRTHPHFASISWEHSHGAALAAIGHLLHPTIGTMVIPPSYARSRLVPWGSRPDLDPRWSVPGRFEVEHGDASGRRLDRVLAIADHPLAQEHLRVCWSNVDGTLNCGHCEKCVRTMVMLAGADQLQHYRTFPDRAALPGLVDGLDGVGVGHSVMWADLVHLPLRPQERNAVARLLDRST